MNKINKVDKFNVKCTSNTETEFGTAIFQQNEIAIADMGLKDPNFAIHTCT